MTYEGTVRLCDKKPRIPKDPIFPELLKSLINNFDSTSLEKLRFLNLCTLGFFGFFRVDELLNVQLKHIKITEEIFLEKSKVDQHRDGGTAYIFRLASKFCPVKLV